MSINDVPVGGVPRCLWPERIMRAEGETDESFKERVRGLRPLSVSIVDTPVDPHCKTSDGRYLAIDWKRGMDD